MRTEEKLASKGWTKQNTIDEPRLSELVHTYEDMGLKVHLEPLHLEEMDECDECMRKDPDRFKTIYTRPTQGSRKSELDELY